MLAAPARAQAGQPFTGDADVFITGEKHPGELSVADLDTILAPLVKH